MLSFLHESLKPFNTLNFLYATWCTSWSRCTKIENFQMSIFLWHQSHKDIMIYFKLFYVQLCQSLIVNKLNKVSIKVLLALMITYDKMPQQIHTYLWVNKILWATSSVYEICKIQWFVFQAPKSQFWFLLIWMLAPICEL